MRQLEAIANPTNIEEDRLKERFINLWRRCVPTDTVEHANAVWNRLATLYSESHRVYHDISHLAHCLKQVDIAHHLFDQPDSVEMAVWFHDVIYDPQTSDDELHSAELFASLVPNNVDGNFVESVKRLIMATTHQYSPTDSDEQYICDIDLSSFGCPWDCFKNDTDAVKAEFVGTTEQYREGKEYFLESMLRRPQIFHSAFFFNRYEKQARNNIERLLGLVRSGRD